MEEIHEAVDYGVVKMNIDTDTQYAFTRAIADHMFKNYSGVLKVDGEVGNKKNYDPRSYLTIGRGRHGRKGEAGGPGAAGEGPASIRRKRTSAKRQAEDLRYDGTLKPGRGLGVRGHRSGNRGFALVLCRRRRAGFP